MSGRADVAVIGGGILGLAFAWTAARHGRSVVLFERGRIAQGASVRNFGMVWPIGQPAGELHQRSLRSRALWDEASRSAGIDLDPCGSIHLAHHPDEMDVLEEFAGRARDLGYAYRLATPDESVRICPAARRQGLLGSLVSQTEACVDPRQAIARLPHWLHEKYGVELQFGTAVAEVSMPQVRATDGRTWTVGRAVVCGGADLQTLFPEVFVESGIRLCKLQMMRTAPQPAGWRIGTMVAGGLTLCHYPTFQVCPSLPALRARFEATMAEFVGLGIHVMASQNALGEVVIGDSHEYDDAIEPFDKTRIDALILGHLATMIDLPDPAVAARWHGIYARHPEQPLFVANPQPEAYVVTAPGGSGMTMSFGHAEAVWSGWPG